MGSPAHNSSRGVPSGAARRGKRVAFCFHHLLGGVDAAGPALLILFHWGKSSTKTIYFFRPNTKIRRLPDLPGQSHFFPVSCYWPLLKLFLIGERWTWPLCITPVAAWLPLIWVQCWDIYRCRAGSCCEKDLPTCTLLCAKKVKRDLETALFLEKAIIWLIDITASYNN